MGCSEKNSVVKMNVGLVGLGKMGSAIALRLIKAKHTVYGYDVDAQVQHDAQKSGVNIVELLEQLPTHVNTIWLMVPAGPIVDSVIAKLIPKATSDHVIIDGGNSKFNDSVRRATELETRGISFLDCGTSGGLRGEEVGFSLMIGGADKAYKQAEPIFKAIAAPNSYAHVGPSGSGHYVKMVHNGIEYALLESYAEGFSLIKNGHYKNLDLVQITHVWSKAAIIRSYILDLSHEIFMTDQKLEHIQGKVDETGMGEWTVQEGHNHNIPVTLIKDAVEIRAWSRKTGGNYATKIVALLRQAFGGHRIYKD